MLSVIYAECYYSEYAECCYPVSFVLSAITLSMQRFVMLSVIYAECYYSEYAESCYAECHLC